MIITRHAIDRYIRRVDATATPNAAREAIAAAPERWHQIGRTRFGQVVWQAGTMRVVTKHDVAARDMVAVTVLGPGETSDDGAPAVPSSYVLHRLREFSAAQGGLERAEPPPRAVARPVVAPPPPPPMPARPVVHARVSEDNPVGWLIRHSQRMKRAAPTFGGAIRDDAGTWILTVQYSGMTAAGGGKTKADARFSACAELRARVLAEEGPFVAPPTKAERRQAHKDRLAEAAARKVARAAAIEAQRAEMARRKALRQQEDPRCPMCRDAPSDAASPWSAGGFGVCSACSDDADATCAYLAAARSAEASFT